jgi:hypothetical protein
MILFFTSHFDQREKSRRFNVRFLIEMSFQKQSGFTRFFVECERMVQRKKLFHKELKEIKVSQS